jgi:hypothetical protein
MFKNISFLNLFQDQTEQLKRTAFYFVTACCFFYTHVPFGFESWTFFISSVFAAAFVTFKIFVWDNDIFTAKIKKEPLFTAFCILAAWSSLSLIVFSLKTLVLVY